MDYNGVANINPSTPPPGLLGMLHAKGNQYKLRPFWAFAYVRLYLNLRS